MMFCFSLGSITFLRLPTRHTVSFTIALHRPRFAVSTISTAITITFTVVLKLARWLAKDDLSKVSLQHTHAVCCVVCHV